MMIVGAAINIPGLITSRETMEMHLALRQPNTGTRHDLKILAAGMMGGDSNEMVEEGVDEVGVRTSMVIGGAH